MPPLVVAGLQLVAATVALCLLVRGAFHRGRRFEVRRCRRVLARRRQRRALPVAEECG